MKIRNIHTGMEHQYNTIDSGNEFLESQENPADWYFVQSLYCDGSGYNGQQSGYVVTDENQEVMYKEFSPINRTNNECEYLAFLKACELAFTNAEIFSDSQLVVFQIIGDYRIKEEKFLPYADKIRKLIIAKNLKIGWIERNKNVAGEYIESLQNKHPTSHNKMKERLENYSNGNYL
jgi:ribonuclease HI